MAPYAEAPSLNEHVENVPRMEGPSRPAMSPNPPRIMIIGAGSRGNSYARAIRDSTNGALVGVTEPIANKRKRLGTTYIWGSNRDSLPGEEFDDWRDFIAWETERRAAKAQRADEQVGDSDDGVDAVFICVQDEMHKEVILGLAPLKLHIMCEKPLATSLDDCVDIYESLLPRPILPDSAPDRIFSIGHVLRYSPHNMLLRKLLVEDRVIGDILSVEHTEPVGWWHFSHSYVRGNWRSLAKAAPSLLTKSCHDIDFLLWLLCSPPPHSTRPPHMPSKISSSGALQYFNKSRKPTAAGNATNCLSCAHEPNCLFSAKKIYLGSDSHMWGFGTGNLKFPIDILVPDIEELGTLAGEKALLKELEKDYDDSMPSAERDKTNWYGRCVFESDNDVCDNQVVTITWDDDEPPLDSTFNSETEKEEIPEKPMQGRRSKQAIFHMTSHTKKQCDRYSQIFGENGEIWADGSVIVHENFMTGETKKYYPHQAGGGHGGGDDGLARQFLLAVDGVKNGGVGVREAQREFLGCDLEEILRSHALVFAAEEARVGERVVGWMEWWDREVGRRIEMG